MDQSEVFKIAHNKCGYYKQCNSMRENVIFASRAQQANKQTALSEKNRCMTAILETSILNMFGSSFIRKKKHVGTV